ncbi:hypothetical protein Btru_048823 [Bulinus truncatus]|nr:hypothetical protein Btru_048823 [Bulinus truncatus]
MVAMINNLLQPQITAQLGIAPNDYRQPVIIDAYVPPAAGQSESDPSLYFLDRSQIDYATAAIDSVCGYWDSEGTDLAPVNSGAAECKTQADFVGEVIAGGVTSDHLEAPFQVSSYPGVDTTTTAAAAPQDAMPEYQQPRGDAPLEAEAGEGMEDVYAAEFDENEEKILRATVKAVQSGTLTPLIKEELRCTIQSRRLAAGKGELHVEFTRPVKRKDAREIVIPVCTQSRDIVMPVCTQSRDIVILVCTQSRDTVIPVCTQSRDIVIPVCTQSHEIAVPVCTQSRDIVVPVCTQSLDIVIPVCTQSLDIAIPMCTQ